MVAIASTKHSYWLSLAFVASVATMIGCLPTQALAFLAVLVHAMQAIAFEWKPGLTSIANGFYGMHLCKTVSNVYMRLLCDFLVNTE